ncbi:MAG: transglycosylase domain-containing protein [Proteobacteria bacterium]|nr:transglycosylase domain-containing protein [Pseudomonadota bacterium]MBU1715087.1 transglycosylase domain-containing protein [Pseudomonadota bacterium]
MEEIKNNHKKDHKDHNDPPKNAKEEEVLNPQQQAIRFKAFRYLFSEQDLTNQPDEKKLIKKLKMSRSLEKSYGNYIKELETNPDKIMVFPWDNPFRRFIFLLTIWGPRSFKWGLIAAIILFVINYIPGPTQHIVEHAIARSIYDAARLSRLPESLESYAHSANIVDANGSIIKSYGKRRVNLQISDQVKTALLACEDHYLLPHPKNSWLVNNFMIHSGVSWFNLLGALKDTLGGRKRGASTIIMQNAKKILGNTDRTMANKIEEIIIAYMLVTKFGKDANLEFYINTVPVGSNIYGFPAAARNYFKKDLAELNTQQILTIASFIPNHNRQLAFYHIVKGQNIDQLDSTMQMHADNAISKINSALAYLKRQEIISAKEYREWLLGDEESIRKIGLRDFKSPLYGEEEWTSWNVIKEVCAQNYLVDGRKVSGAQLLLDERGDVIIETQVDLVLAEKTKEIITTYLNSPSYREILKKRNQNTWRRDLQQYQDRGITPPYSTFDGFMEYLNRHINIGVMIINQQGNILAYIGGKEFLQGSGDSDQQSTDKEHSHENPLIIDLMNKKAKIAPSSTIKPIIAYYAMVNNNANLQTTFADKPIEYKYSESAGGKIWLPRNSYPYDEKGRGNNRYLGREYTLLEAQILSINTIFARLYTNRVLRNAMLIGLDRIELDYNKEDAKNWPFGIGASSVPVQQWLGLYNAFLDGNYLEPGLVKRILVNNKVIYERISDENNQPILLFDAKNERDDTMRALYEVCNRGTGSAMKTEFKYHHNLVSGKTGTATDGQTSLFVGHFNPYRDRKAHPDQMMTMIVAVTTNTGGYKNIGTSTQGPVIIAGRIMDYLFNRELQKVMDQKIEESKNKDSRFRNNHIYWANVNRYMDVLLHQDRNGKNIYKCMTGIDNYQEALEQILNSNNRIYQGRSDLFDQLVDFYCDQERVVKRH